MQDMLRERQAWLEDYRARIAVPGLDSDQILALAQEAEDHGFNRGHAVFYIMAGQDPATSNLATWAGAQLPPDGVT